MWRCVSEHGGVDECEGVCMQNVFECGVSVSVLKYRRVDERERCVSWMCMYAC